ncbi:MAG TPA: cyclic nucleotide-binding domain-containing protein [Chthoniobacterales bacterium]|jgi:CRP-like cAMP-binding protein
MKPIRSLIADHPFLRDLNPSHLDLLSKYAMERTFEEGDLIFKQGDMANRFYLIQSGHVRLSSNTEAGVTSEIETIGTGDVLGWSWLFEPRLWHFDAHALEKTETVFLYATPLLAEFEADPAFGYEMMSRMAAVAIRRLQMTREKLLVPV